MTAMSAAEVLPPTPSVGQRSIRRRLFAGVSWTAAGSIVSQGSSFLTMILLARILGRVPFGKFALIQSTVLSVTTVSGLGLGITSTKYVSQYRTTDQEKAGRILALSALITLASAVCFCIGFGFAIGYADFGGATQQLRGCLRISLIWIFFATITSYQIGALAGFEAFPKIALINTGYSVATVALSWACAVPWGLDGAVWAQSAGAVLAWGTYQLVLAMHCSERRIAIRYRDGWRERGILFRFAAPATACGVVSSIAIWSANVLLVRLSGFAELAIFSAALSMRSMVLFTPGLILRVTTPVLNHLLALGDPKTYKKIFWQTVGTNGLIALLPAALLVVGGQKVLELFGHDFRTSRRLVPLLLASVVLEVLANNLFQALFASGLLWHALGIVLVWAVVLLGTIAVGLGGQGAPGLAAAYLIAWAVSAGLYAIAAIRQVRRGGARA